MLDEKKSSVKGFKNIIALGSVSFFTDVSTEMCFSVLPIFIVKELGATRAVLGFIEGLAEATSYIFRMLSGVISDKIGKRKSLIFVGYGFSTIIKPFFSTARVWTDALIIRFGDRVGKGVRQSPRDALLSESVPKERVGKAFGLHRTLDQLGAIVGPSLAFMLIPLLGIRGIFWTSFIPGFMALMLLLFLVEERMGKRRRAKILSDVRNVLRGDFTPLLLVMATFSLGAFNFSFILLKANELGVSEAFIPIIYATINIAHTAMGIPAGFLSDRIGKERVLLIGYATFSLTSLLCMMRGGSPIHAVLIAAVYGVYIGVIETVQRAIVPSYAPSDLRATAYGVYYLVVGSSFLAANILVGTLWEYIGIHAAFTYSLVTSMASIIGMMGFIRLKTT